MSISDEIKLESWEDSVRISLFILSIGANECAISAGFLRNDQELANYLSNNIGKK